MATYYWVGGSGTWSDVSTGNWSLTSGGTPTNFSPSSLDDVIFDSNSSATSYSVTVTFGYTTGGVARNITLNGPASGNLTFTGTVGYICWGSFFISATGVTYTHSSSLLFSSTSAGNTVTTNGVPISSAMTFGGVGGVWDLTGALTLTSTTASVLTNGTLNTNGFNISCSGFTVTGTTARTLNLGSSIVTCTGTSPWTATTVTNLTFNAGTSTIICSNASITFTAGGLTYYDITFSSTALVLGTFTGAFTCRNLTIATRAASGRGQINLSANITITGLFDVNAGTIGSARTLITSTVLGTARTITAASKSLTDVDFLDITAAGAGAPFTGTRLGDWQGNTNITFPASKTVYWNLAAGGNWSATAWATTSGGTPATANFPLAQDAVIIENTGLNTSATITMNASYGFGSLNCSTRTTAMTLALGATSPFMFGNFTLSTSVNIGTTANIQFYNRTGNATITSAGRSMVNITINCLGGTVLLGDAFLTTGTITLTSGTFNTQNFSVTLATFNGTGTTTRALTLGTSIVTCTGTSPWTFTAITGLTYSGASATINCSNNSPTFAGGSLTYNIVNFTATVFLTGTITGANTFGILSFANRAADGIGQFIFGSNQAITTLTLPNSTSIKRRLRFYSSLAGTPITLGVGAVTGLTNMDFRDITITGASSPWSGTGLGNELGNTNITFGAGTTYYWNLAAGGNWNANAWATTSGGTPAVGNFPLAQDTAIIENTGLNTGATITINGNYSINTLNMSGRTNAMTWAHGAFGIPIFQDLLTTSSVTSTSTGNFTFAGKGRTQLVTSSGATFPQAIIVQTTGGTVRLVDNMTVNGAFAVTLANGTLDLNNNTLTASFFAGSGSTVRTLAFGTTGVINITGNNGTVWTTTTVTNMSITGTSRTVNFIYAGAVGTRTISNGAVEDRPLDFNITAGTDIVTVSNARNLNFTGFSGTIGNATRGIYGNLTIPSSIVVATAGALVTTFGATSGTQTITTNGEFLDFPITFGQAVASTTTFVLADNLSIGGGKTAILNAGTLSLGTNTLSCGFFSSSTSLTRAIAFGTGRIDVIGFNATIFNMIVAGGFTYTGTPTINATYFGNVGQRNFYFGTTSGLTEANVVSFNISAGADSIDIRNFRNLNFTGFSGTLINLNKVCYGNLIFSSTMTISPSSATFSFVATSGTQDVTSNGITINSNFVQSGIGGTVRLLDNVTLGSAQQYSFTNGNLNLNERTLSVGFFISSNSNIRTINFDDGTIAVTASGTAWDATTSTNLTLAGAGVISMTSASAKTFAGGSKFYPTLNQGGAGALSITGANTFGNITNTTQPATITFPTASITTVLDMTLAGIAGSLITINSSTAGVRATLFNPNATTISVNFCTIIDSNATGGTRWSAYFTNGNIDAGNNAGWVFIAPLQSNNLIFAEFVRVTTPSAIYRFASTPSALTIPAVDSQPFNALGQLIRVNEAQQDIKSTANETTFTLVGIDTAMLGWVLGQEIKGSKIEAWHGFFDETGALITDIGTGGLTKFFTGYVNSFTISEQWMEEVRIYVGVITVSASSIQLILKNRVAGRFTNNNSWQFFDSGDTSMNRVSFVTNINYYFGKGASPNS